MSAIASTGKCLIEFSPNVVMTYQQGIILFMSVVTAALLKPLGVPVMVSQFLGAVLLGPTFLGRMVEFKSFTYPDQSLLALETYARVAMAFGVFFIGIEIDLRVLAKPERKIIIIGITTIGFSLALAFASANFISKIFKPGPDISTTLIYLGFAQSMNSFPVIACYLHELKILNSDFSRVAFSCSLISGFISYFSQMTAVLNLLASTGGDSMLRNFLAFVLVYCIIMYLFRPILKRMIEMMSAEQQTSKGVISFVLVINLVVFYLGCIYRVHPYFGCFLLGIIIPTQSSLGSALVKRMHFVSLWLVMPVYYAFHAFSIDLSQVDLTTLAYTMPIIIICWIGKFLGAFLPAYYCNMTLKEAILLGITVNTQGFMELTFLRYLVGAYITYAAYNIACVWTIIITGCSAPIMLYLYKSTLGYRLYYNRNIQSSNQSSELRVAACLFDEADVPLIIHLLKSVSHPKDSPVIASIIHFVELAGNAAPSIVSHSVIKDASGLTISAQRILNAFRRFEKINRQSVVLHPYTITSPYKSMHIDVSMLSIKERTSLILIPFHSQPSTGGENNNIRAVNRNVLENAPCSVGFIINRGRLGGLKYIFETWISYSVVVLFFGGEDDREALAVGERMLGNTTIELTVLRFSKPGDKVSRTLDDLVIAEFRHRSVDNDRMVYINKELLDAVEVVEELEAMQDGYDLIILGRRHNEDSPFVGELSSWNTYPELGDIGDIFMTSNHGGDATILVVQYQQNELEE